MHDREVLGLVGESGSGKTTTGRVVVKLTKQTAGRVSLDGEDVTGEAASYSLCRQEAAGGAIE